jgi:hypothetical protein
MKPKRTVPWRVVEHSRNVHEIRYDDVGAGFNTSAKLSSDHHWDNPHCDRKLLKRHLDEALEHKRPVIIYGDFFCAMQGKWDKRSAKTDIRPEHNTGSYLDSLVHTAADWLAPYAEVLAVIGPGNHETAILKRHESNLSERLVEAIRARCPKSPVKLGGFSGWVRFQFKMRDSCQQSVRLWYHHGYGGGGPVTRGVIQSNRKAVYVEADVIASGHTHDYWLVPIQRIQLSKSSQVCHTEQIHVSTPGYKDEYEDGYGGFHIERGGPPKPVGCAWLDFSYSGRRGIEYSVRSALRGQHEIPAHKR